VKKCTTGFTTKLPKEEGKTGRDRRLKLLPERVVSDKPLDFIGASEGIRTLDIHLGKVTLYQAELRSLPCKVWPNYENPAQMQALFCPLTCAGPRNYSPGLIF
jgi:hypothetical protein